MNKENNKKIFKVESCVNLFLHDLRQTSEGNK